MIDSFNVTESYQWHDDIMEITTAIVRGTDEARLVSIADHFKVDLSEIREWIEEKEKRKFAKPQTNADRIRAMTDEELAELLTAVAKKSAEKLCESLKTVDVDLSACDFGILEKTHLEWLKSPVNLEAGK